MKFDYANQLFKDDKIRELSSSRDGLRFLKIRSLSRKEYLQFVICNYDIDVGNAPSREWFRLIFESNISTSEIHEAIIKLYKKARDERRKNEDNLISELYKVQSFEWGGLHQNSLEQTIVNNYVKKITNFDQLSSAVENELTYSMKSYVFASWYNHWCSIIVEDIFNDHQSTIPAVGQIKKIDFFINEKPFDLKVTYMPEGYIKDYRKSDGLISELALMKKACKSLAISFDNNLSDAVLISDLWQKLDDHPSSEANELIEGLHDYRKSCLNTAIRNPKYLVRWLYENQGVRRFDATNRLFLILVDKNNFFGSWKLKRAKSLLTQEINNHLNNVDQVGFDVDFCWAGSTYTTEADAIFVVKD